ncbi:hypothetical protein M432DRAFT_627156 [Thermoascus aurantiacus ATCC 26904]
MGALGRPTPAGFRSDLRFSKILWLWPVSLYMLRALLLSFKFVCAIRTRGQLYPMLRAAYAHELKPEVRAFADLHCRAETFGNKVSLKSVKTARNLILCRH